ncbi:hypothetical protein ABT324_30800 [Saccharopolyspora sp. NPDC000359]|uniref:hypothetical protein n=1 Tax=Saccharopolyspora sp. NPDC000359 TaxID=3154251 RepID=UPI00331A6564
MTHPTSMPVPGHQGPPASAAPLRQLFSQNPAGVSVDGNYVVLPAILLERMPLPFQQQLATALAALQTEGQQRWPIYKVTPQRYLAVSELFDSKLAEAGIYTDLGDDGELVHRWRSTGEIIEHPDQEQVLVSCPDPLQDSPAPQ